MTGWLRRLARLAALLIAFFVVRTALSLWPPSLQVAPDWYALTGVTVINPGRQRYADQTLILRGGRIESMRAGVPETSLLPRWRVFKGRFVLPGVVDLDARRLPSIAHLQRMFGVYFLFGGVTTVRVFDGSENVVALQRRIDAGEIPGPRLITCSRMLEGAPPPCGGAHLLSALSPAPPGERVSERLRGWERLDAAGLDGLVGSASAQRSALIPNLFRWHQLTVDDDARAHTPGVEFMPRFYREVTWPHEAAQLAGGADPSRAVQAMEQAVRRLHDAGVSIHVGSATPSPFVTPGIGALQEIARLAAAGFTLEDAWAAATRSAGEALGIPQLGVIEEGAPADLLVFRQDPTQDPDAILTLEAVVTQGRLYPHPLLGRYVLEYVRYTRGRAYEWLSMAVARLGLWWSGAQAVDPS